MAHEKATAWDDGSQLLSMQVVAQVQGVLERFQVAIAQQIQQLGMQQQYHQAMHQQMLQQVLQQQQEQKALLQRSREEGTSQSTTHASHWPQVYMQPPAGQHPALSKQPLLQLPPLLQSIPTASKSERPIGKPRAAKSQAEEKLSERRQMDPVPNHQVSPADQRDHPRSSASDHREVQNEEPKLEKDDENVQNVQNFTNTKASETVEAKATEVVEMAVSVVPVTETQNAPDSSADAAEYMSRIERCHEETMKKVQVETKEAEEAEESRENEESNLEESEEPTSGGAARASWAKPWNEVNQVHGPRRGKTGPRSSQVPPPVSRGSTRGKMNRRSGEVGELRWRPRYR